MTQPDTHELLEQSKITAFCDWVPPLRGRLGRSFGLSSHWLDMFCQTTERVCLMIHLVMFQFTFQIENIIKI